VSGDPDPPGRGTPDSLGWDQPMAVHNPVDNPGDAVAGAASADPAQDQDAGADAVRAALNRARSAAIARGTAAAGRPSSRGLRRRGPGDQSRSGSGPDARDPQLVARNIARLVDERGWQTPVAVGGVIGRWASVVGAEVAGHCEPESFVEGVLTVRADSSAWATQVRLLVPTLLRRLAEEVGEGTVDKVVVKGPSAPSWRKGPRVAPGSQGPRDTYG
jgi:predicted nucleic acid-binding Zn ribbon protein